MVHGFLEPAQQDEEVGGVKIARGRCELWDGGWVMKVDDVVTKIAEGSLNLRKRCSNRICLQIGFHHISY